MTSYMNYCRCRDTYLQIMSPGRLWLCSGHDLLLPPHSGRGGGARRFHLLKRDLTQKMVVPTINHWDFTSQNMPRCGIKHSNLT